MPPFEHSYADPLPGPVSSRSGERILPWIPAGRWRCGTRLTEANCWCRKIATFVMGDNRNHSRDSRYWAMCRKRNIVGTPFLIYFSVRKPSATDDTGLPDDRLGKQRDGQAGGLRTVEPHTASGSLSFQPGGRAPTYHARTGNDTRSISQTRPGPAPRKRGRATETPLEAFASICVVARGRAVRADLRLSKILRFPPPPWSRDGCWLAITFWWIGSTLAPPARWAPFVH